jgi:glyoxylase-like metal-dependent hydrolase (beta-lactamase superfamily II)
MTMSTPNPPHDPPVAANPMTRFGAWADRPDAERGYFWSGGPIRIAEGTWYQSILSGVTAFDTDAGIVLVDTGSAQFGPTIASLLRQATTAAIHTVVLTHGHIDHAYGTTAFLTPDQQPPEIVAHRNIADRFDRYTRTPGHNTTINNRQFAGIARSDTIEGADTIRFAWPDHPPTVLYDHHHHLDVGGVTFELHHARGETDDHTWIWCPQRQVLCTGDLIIGCLPNAGNPQKAQRYPWEWSTALRAMADLGARTLAPGHGAPIIDDPDTIRRVLTDTADRLDLIVNRVLDLLDDSSPPHTDIVTNLDLPPASEPWLAATYDDDEFIARNVIRYFGGWWNGRPSDLKPAPRVTLARHVADLVGGPVALAEHAARVAATDLASACHLADYALEAAPHNPEVASMVADLYRRRADTETSLMAINLYRTAAAYADQHRPYQ